MKEYKLYLDQLDLLVDSALKAPTDIETATHIKNALDGQPTSELHRLVPAEHIQNSGAFFTGSKLTEKALKLLVKTIDDDSIILDPACGVGDLLITCASHLLRKRSPKGNFRVWSKQITGRDLHTEFIDVARRRLTLTAIKAGILSSTKQYQLAKHPFPDIKVGCGLADTEAIWRATHIVTNPPFNLVKAPESCEWSTGKVNAAALFLETCAVNARPGTRITAILPDVLRSGSRYVKWRQKIESYAAIDRIELHGRFDKWADVDVFIADFIVRDGRKPLSSPNWKQPINIENDCVSSRFDIHVGSVVDYRDAKKGPWHPFIISHGLPKWCTVYDVPKMRRFSGTVFPPPFVVVRRNSRVRDKHRAIGTIINVSRSVAVENHLLVLSPKDKTVKSCQDLLRNFKMQETKEWLDQYMRCKHLTISALSNLPWWRKNDA